MAIEETHLRPRGQFRQYLPIALLLFALPLLIATAILLVAWFRLDAPSFDRGSQRAAALIAALEHYRQVTGEHPRNLETLVPDYLEQIPNAGWRYPYEYGVCRTTGVGYVLYFPTNQQRYCGYLSNEATWQCIDSTWLPPWFLIERPCQSEW
jgi:hypothetical protein